MRTRRAFTDEFKRKAVEDYYRARENHKGHEWLAANQLSSAHLSYWARGYKLSQPYKPQRPVWLPEPMDTVEKRRLVLGYLQAKKEQRRLQYCTEVGYSPITLARWSVQLKLQKKRKSPGQRGADDFEKLYWAQKYLNAQSRAERQALAKQVGVDVATLYRWTLLKGTAPTEEEFQAIMNPGRTYLGWTHADRKIWAQKYRDAAAQNEGPALALEAGVSQRTLMRWAKAYGEPT